jgi:hypothetical protein
MADLRVMAKRKTILPDVIADVMSACRRRCCICFGLNQDNAEKKGQIAHLDRNSANDSPTNLAFLCFDHHDQYDSRPSQAKGLTIEEVKRYRTELLAFVGRQLPASDAEIVVTLTNALDRPAFRTPFRHESSLERFREAISDTIDAINTGYLKSGSRVSAKFQIRDSQLRLQVDRIVQGLVALRATFDNFIRTGGVRHCGCGIADCPVYFFEDSAAREMDHRRRELLRLAHNLNPIAPSDFYDLD